MHTLIINKTNSVILQSRFDNSTGEKMAKEQVLQTYCEDTGTDISEVAVIEIPFQKLELTIGKHVYTNGQIGINPAWIEPPAVETSNIPVSDPGANQ